jgi:hypothetical protein
MKNARKVVVVMSLLGVTCLASIQASANWWGGDRWDRDRWWGGGPGYYGYGPGHWGGPGGYWGGPGGYGGGPGGYWGGPGYWGGGPWGYGYPYGVPYVRQAPAQSTEKAAPPPKSPE